MTDVTTLQEVELAVLGPLHVRQAGAAVSIPGAKPRAVLTMLGLHDGSVVPADTLLELLWGADPPRTAAKALQTHISALRRTLGDGLVLTEGAGWRLAATEVDASRYRTAARRGRDTAAAGDLTQAVARFDEALALWRGVPELPDTRRGTAERTRWIEGHAALVEDRAETLLATGRAAEIIGELETAVADAPLRERRWGQLMLALYRAGRQGEALGAYRRARRLLSDELGVEPGPELRSLETAIIGQATTLEVPAAQNVSSVTRAVTFLLTDIEGSTAAWEADAVAMATALARHDELVEQVVTSRGGRLIKTRGEGDATFSVFDRPSAAAEAALELQDAIVREPWALADPMRIRVALHTGEAELRDGDYFGRAVNRAARLRSLAAGGQILCSGASAELVIDSLPDDVALTDLGMRQLRNLARPEHVFELRMHTADDRPTQEPNEVPLQRPPLPAVLAGPGPFVGRGSELERLFSAWQTALAGSTNAVLIAGEPGVGKTRLAGEWSRQAYHQGAIVLYGRCDEDLGAPYQPFAEALRSLVPCLGATRLRGLRGVEALLALAPGLTDVLPDVAAPTRADPDTERYALFDAVVALLGVTAASAPIVLILDDLHWAAKPTLLLLRHVLRFGDHARVQIIGTYRSTDLDRAHPLAAMLADLHRDGTAHRLQLTGLDEDDVTAYVVEAGYDDEELARALASVTAGNPFFLIEALRHVHESGGVWDPSTLPQGVREAVSRRLSRLPAETNKALAAAAVVGSRFALDLVEQVLDRDLVDAFDEAAQAGIVIEEPGGHYRFNHAIVRQSLLAELASVRRMRLHQRIATTLEAQPGADGELLAELAYHYFECAWAGNAVKAVEYCRRAADQAMARLGYEGAAELYDQALHALQEIDDELPDPSQQMADLLIARCEALLAAGDVASATGAVDQLTTATIDSDHWAAWATCFDGQLAMLIHPERLDEIEVALGAAAHKLAELPDAAGEAKAHTVRAACLARLGRIGDCEAALDDALTAARRAREHRRVNAVLAGAPVAALWGPSPVARAGGRCLDVVRLLRITIDSPAVEATSMRCQAVLEAFRGRSAAARRMIDSARRTVSELGLRHALLEVEQFAGIVELVNDDPLTAEAHLRKAYNGFRRMGLEADTAETAALLGRTYLALGRDSDADELCRESERLAGHALKPSIAWRTLRAQLLSRDNQHDEARHIAEDAVKLAERTDLLVDHGDACLVLATVLDAGGDRTKAQAAAEQAVGLYERKGAAALAEMARDILGQRDLPPAPSPSEAPDVELDNACARAVRRLDAAYDRDAWDEVEQQVAAVVSCESLRKVVGVSLADVPYSEWEYEARRYREILGRVRYRHVVVAVRGERLALTRLEVGPADLSPGAPRDELLQLYGLDPAGRIAMLVWFDVEDIDAALAELDAAYTRFEQERRRASGLENAASRVIGHLLTCFASGADSTDITDTFAPDYYLDDRRRVVNSGTRTGGRTAIEDLRAAADLGLIDVTAAVIATRGERLALTRARWSGQEHDTEAFQMSAFQLIEIEFFSVVESDADQQVVAHVAFDLDDFQSAIGELDARYLAGEAAAHAHTWSVILDGHAAVNQHEMPPTTSDCVSFDHRRATAFGPGELIDLFRAGWDLNHEVRTYVEAVHRISDLGAVCTHVGHSVAPDGLDAEWRGIELLTIRGDLIDRCEVFDESDLETALAKFDQIGRVALDNTASRALDRVNKYLAVRDWAAIERTLAEDVIDDRRRIANAGVRSGREAVLAGVRTAADLGARRIASTAIATRGQRLALCRARYSGEDRAPGAFYSEVLSVVEVDADERVVAHVGFALNDFQSAMAELDERYLAGEAAAHAATWSVVTEGFAAINRRELPRTTTNWVNVDHRQGTAFAPGEMTEYMLAAWDLEEVVRIYVEAVHALSNVGAVLTSVTNGRSQDGFDAEWRTVQILTTDGHMTSGCELFDEADIGAALARFEELQAPGWRLNNAASQVMQRFLACFAARDWDAMPEILGDDFSYDDRRRVVGSGARHNRDAQVEDMRASADLWTRNVTPIVIATRGRRLVLTRLFFWGRDRGPEAFLTEVFGVVEINADERIVAIVTFDLDDIDAAFAELDDRYVAGEAAAYVSTWSTIAHTFAALGRRELPLTTNDFVDIDHRRATAFAPGELMKYLRAGWEVNQQVKPYVETVHRLNELGALVTHAAHLTSRAGFEAGWRTIDILTVEGDLISRCELFDEEDLGTAAAVFDQLLRPAQHLDNAASRVAQRFLAHFAASDWESLAENLAEEFSQDDRRRVVGAGVRQGREAEIADLRAIAGLSITNVASTVVATRGERLVLLRVGFSFRNQGPEAFLADLLGVAQTDADERIVAAVAFDLDDVGAAFAELDARYLADEAAPYAATWSVITGACAALNRGGLMPTTPDWVSIDHRRGIAFAPGDLAAYIRSAWDLLSGGGIYLETAHRLSNFGGVVTWWAYGTSQDDSDVKFRGVNMLMVQGDLINRVEVFDEADLDAALARFDELVAQRSAPDTA